VAVGSLACCRVDSSLLVENRGFPLNLLLVVAVAKLHVIYPGLQTLHGHGRLYLKAALRDRVTLEGRRAFW